MAAQRLRPQQLEAETVSQSKTSFLYKLIISGISYSYRNVSNVFIFALSSTLIK